jgi:hypothetical protein
VFTALVPRLVAPSLNVTVPVGAPPPKPATVALNVTDWPKLLGFVEVVSDVEVTDAA